MKHANLFLPFSLALLFGFTPLAVGCENAQAEIKFSEPAPVEVLTSEAELADAPVHLRLTGTLRGKRETDLAANVAGRLTATKVERGQTVKEGELLLTVDTRSAQLALNEAKVSVESSRAQDEINRNECERYERLKAVGAVTALEYDQVTAKCKTAPLSVQAAEARQMLAAKNVGDGMIRAPFSGVVTERYVEAGEYVTASSRVVSLAQVDELRALFSVPEKSYPLVKQGAPVQVRVAAYGEQVFPGKVTHISGAVRDTRDILVEAAIPNPEARLLPGMFVEVLLDVGTKKVPSVPKSAVFQENGKSNVMVAAGERLVQRVIAVETVLGDRVLVRTGLAEGDRVATTHSPELKNGMRIK